MNYIRRQRRAQPNHNPNTNVLCEDDADLIMLGLATHEPHFTIIRKEFTPFKPRPCDICHQLGTNFFFISKIQLFIKILCLLIGHEMKDCQGADWEKAGNLDDVPIVVAESKYIFVKIGFLGIESTLIITLHLLLT